MPTHSGNRFFSVDGGHRRAVLMDRSISIFADVAMVLAVLLVSALCWAQLSAASATPTDADFMQVPPHHASGKKTLA
jgi:hypothetical protein